MEVHTKHEYLITACCAVLLVGCMATSVAPSSSAQTLDSTGEMIIDTTNIDPNFNARDALGDELLEKSSNANDETAISYNGQTGKTTIKEIAPISPNSSLEIAPYIPLGLEVVVPVIAKSVIEFVK